MKRGALLFAFNTDSVNYFKMAESTAKRIKHFLGINSSIVTDENSVEKSSTVFDKVFYVEPDKSNTKKKKVWINKGRYQAYELSPYEETLLIDTDYLVNSNRLNLLFDICQDYVCPSRISFLMQDVDKELISPISYETLWATIILFKKTLKSKQLFECIKMVQENYTYYAELYGMYNLMYRNDYALTIAHRIVNGHYDDNACHMPWQLLHADHSVNITKLTDEPFNTEYVVTQEKNINGKIKPYYITVKDTDFHCMNKENFMKLL